MQLPLPTGTACAVSQPSRPQQLVLRNPDISRDSFQRLFNVTCFLTFWCFQCIRSSV